MNKQTMKQKQLTLMRMQCW